MDLSTTVTEFPAPETQRRALTGLAPEEYEHPFDKRALDALEGTPGIETLVRKCNEYGVDRMLRIQFTGSNLKITERNHSELYRVLREACEVVHLSPPPDLYIAWGHEVNAFTAGVEKPIVVLNSGCVDLLTRDELLFVISHELGHIKSNHVLYYQLASVLPFVGSLIGSATLGFGNLLSTGIQLALLNWQRMSEFTSDRAGLLGCQNPKAVTSAMLKIAGLPEKYYGNDLTEQFILQAREFEGYDYDNLDRIAKFLSILWQNHPWTVMRAAELLRWIDSGSYEKVMDRNRLTHSAAAASPPLASYPRFCPHCGQRLEQVVSFCSWCGGRVAS